MPGQCDMTTPLYRVHSDPDNVRGIGLVDTLFMVYQGGLCDTLLHHSLQAGLGVSFTPSQGECHLRTSVFDSVWRILYHVPYHRFTFDAEFEKICRVHARMHGEQFAACHGILEDAEEGGGGGKGGGGSGWGS